MNNVNGKQGINEDVKAEDIKAEGVKTKQSLSLKFKIMLAVGCITMTTLSSGLVGWLAFENVGDSLKQIELETVPLLISASNISKVGAVISGGSSFLVAAKDSEEIKVRYSKLQKTLEILDQNIEMLEKYDLDESLLMDIFKDSSRIKGNFNVIKTDLLSQYRINNSQENAFRNILNLKQKFNESVVPYLKETDDKATSLMEQAMDEPNNAAFALFDISLIYNKNKSANALRINVNDLFGVVVNVYEASSIQSVTAFQEQVTKPVTWAKEALLAFKNDKSDKAIAMRQATNQLLTYVTAEDGIFLLRKNMLKKAYHIREAVKRNESLLNSLMESIQQIVESSNLEINEAINKSDKDILQGEILLGGISGLAVILAFAISFIYIGRMIVGRIIKLNVAMGELANGNLDADIPTGGWAQDEIGLMAGTLATFKENALNVARLKDESDSIKVKNAQEKRQAMQNLANDFDQRVQGIVSQVSKSVIDLEKTSKDMSDTTVRAIDRSSQVSDASGLASENMDGVSSTSQELSSSITEISERTNEAAQATSNLANEAKTTKQAVDSLSVAASKIGDVVNLINDIAAQTNLLALNATIESARAGEAGKGFAVVANEVKTLATQTANATNDIADQINEIKKTVNTAADATNRVTRDINGVDEIVAGIASATTQQMSATEEISRSIRMAADSTRLVSSNIAEVLQASQYTGTASKELSSEVGTVSAGMDKLRSEFNAFLNEIRDDNNEASEV